MIKDIEREFNAANFARGSSQLSETAKSVLNKLVKLLAKDEALSVKFIGHTSSDGDDAFNQQLSKDRAKAAASYLESKGINYIRIGHEGKGSSELKNKLDPTSEENCRIEIILL
jgi:outer membrane protein OmpA-like peptidoglycan-associated protein